MAREVKKRVSWADWFRWWGIVLGGLLVLLSVVPAVPWRYSRTDTNMGNRFVMDRFYSLWGATNQFGNSVSWFTMKTKFQQKNQEFGRATPLGALVGTVAQGLDTGGAAVGCALWQACKEHVGARFSSYQGVAYAGAASCASLALGVFCCLATVMYSNLEGAPKSKKKKKKHHHDDDWECSPQAKTMIASICAFGFSFGGVSAFILYLDMVLKDLQNTAYYPYAASHLGPFIGGLGSFFIFVSMMIAINRVTPICGHRSDEEETFESMGPPQYAGAYGKGPWGKGPYGKGPYGKGKDQQSYGEDWYGAQSYGQQAPVGDRVSQW